MTVGRDVYDPRSARPSKRGRRPRLRRGTAVMIAGALLAVGSLAVVLADGSWEARAGREAPVKTVAPPAPPPVPVDLFIGPEAPPTRIVEGAIEPDQFLATMLTDAGLSGGEADRAVRALSEDFDPTKSRPGDRYRVDVYEDGTLARFEYQTAPDAIYVVAPAGEGQLNGDKLDIALEREVVEVDGTIEHSLWLAFEAAGESPVLAASLTQAFRFDIDFFHDTRKGDRFRFFVEKFTHEGELVRYGQIFAAEYIGAADSPIGTKRLYWFEDEETRTEGFYDEDGKAAQRAFLRSPLEYTRISSGFGYRRHPILGKRHFHGGIDYAAPIGTPVRSVADGVVSFAGYAGPNGKMVKLKHAGGYLSYYLHLSRVLVRPGQRVNQSTLVGRVGSTGRSTGPHLDFRLKRHGKYLNPRHTVAPRTKSVPRRIRDRFLAAITPWQDRLLAGRRGGGSTARTVAAP